MEAFHRQFGTGIYHKLGTELRLLKLAGAITEKDGILRLNRRGMYIINVMMREFFASLNTLRE